MTSDNSWDRAKQTMQNVLWLDERRILCIYEVRNELKALASLGIPTAPDFTLHNEVHSDNLVLLLGELSKHLKSPKLNEYEVYLLVAAAYLHDIGMFVGAGRFQRTILPDLAQSLAVCSHRRCDDGEKYLASLEGKSLDQQIRAVHHLVSARMLDEDGVAQFHLPADDLPHIITVCRGHRKADLTGRGCDCYKTIPTKLGEVRRDLLAGLLRLADALDFYPDRTPYEVLHGRAYDFLTSPIALKHWLHHCFTRSVYVTIGDQGGNRYLDCQISFPTPATNLIKGQSYEVFMRPLLEQFLEEVQNGDFSRAKYPATLFECLGVKDIQIKFNMSSELGVRPLPQKIVDEIQQSGCQDAPSFISYLSSKNHKKSLATLPIMDRRPEVKTFGIMLDGDDLQHQLLLMVGEHGQGKTLLMNTFEQMCREHQVPCYKVDLSHNTKAEEILDGIWQCIGPHHFRRYSASRERTVVMDPRPLLERQRELTQCFFADWQAFTGKFGVVLLLDTYERAASTTKDWLENFFLEGLQNVDHAIVVIGGREWPEIGSYWSAHSYRFPLKGVQLRDYKEYAKQLGVSISEDEVALLHQKWAGLPKLFDEYLKLLALKNSASSSPTTV